MQCLIANDRLETGEDLVTPTGELRENGKSHRRSLCAESHDRQSRDLHAMFSIRIFPMMAENGLR
jgi:hypothetical protein